LVEFIVPVVAAEQGDTLGVGTGTFWLSPGVPRSVTPSGMLELAVGPVVRPGVDPLELDAGDIADELPVSEPHAVDKVEPPPSNAEFDVVLGHGMTSGLVPGWLSSVAPSGIALELEGVVPSGEVVPMPAEGAVCAHAVAAPINQIIAAKVHARRIEVSRVKTHGSSVRVANRRAPMHRGSQGNPCVLNGFHLLNPAFAVRDFAPRGPPRGTV
jgi:hypothetical protein